MLLLKLRRRASEACGTVLPHLVSYVPTISSPWSEMEQNKQENESMSMMVRRSSLRSPSSALSW
jgi:hypothetical protein